MGGWLRASPGRNNSGKDGSRSGAASSNNSMGSSHTGEAPNRYNDHPRVRDMPTKRNLNSKFSRTGDGRTGDRSRQYRDEVTSPNGERNRYDNARGQDLRDSLETRREQDLRSKLMENNLNSQRERSTERSRDGKGIEKADSYLDPRVDVNRNGRHSATGRDNPLGGPDMHGTRGRRRGYYVRKYRNEEEESRRVDSHALREEVSRKRRPPHQVWVAKGDVDKHGGDDTFIRDTRQKTASVFDRIQKSGDKAASPGSQGRRDQ